MKTDAVLELLVSKLQKLARLGVGDKKAILSLPVLIEKTGAGRHLIREGTKPDRCCLLLKGFACRYKVTIDGRRQIVSFHVAGDILDIQHLYLELADHHVQTITAATVAWVPKSNLQNLARLHPPIAEALWKDSLIDASVFREWVLNVGRRRGEPRLAHMLCEFVARCATADLGMPVNMHIPLTQDQIGDATGMTSVHVNRMLKKLTADGLLEGSGRAYRVKDWDGLKRFAAFDSAYLHQMAA